jgi:hypothetical protein
MSDDGCATMETYCLERARLHPRNRGRWIAQAERWHELARARSAWRLQKGPLQAAMLAGSVVKPQRQQG